MKERGVSRRLAPRVRSSDRAHARWWRSSYSACRREAKTTVVGLGGVYKRSRRGTARGRRRRGFAIVQRPRAPVRDGQPIWALASVGGSDLAGGVAVEQSILNSCADLPSDEGTQRRATERRCSRQWRYSCWWCEVRVKQ